jgi:hydrogenase-4 component B
MLVVWLVFSPFIGALIAYILGRRNEKARDCFAIVLTALELVLAVVLAFVHSGGSFLQVSGFLVTGLSFEVNGFKAAYAVITALMWAGTTLFAPEYFRHEKEGLERYWMFILLTLGATEGVMLSGDLMTTFIFFEILSFTSFTWVIHEQTKEAVKAGYTYLFIAVFGGLVLFMGLALLYYETGTLSYADLKAAVDACPDRGMILAAGICVLLGFGAKAGMFPLHVWLPKAHPVAPSPASALLSGILTKVGIYGILMITLHALVEDYVFGSIILIAGMITMLLGAVLGVFSVNLKRTLACSSMSQIGFILTGVGMLILLSAAGSEEGYAIALPGLLLHMVNHSIIKLTLFMCAGVVVMNLHKLNLDEIRGWGRKKNKLKIAFALGALGISGVPLMNGYMSKTLLHEGIVEGIHLLEGISGYLKAAEWIFLVSGGLTFCYMLKLFICIFVEENKDPVLQQKYDMPGAYMNLTSTIAILGSSIFCLLLGQPLISTRLGAFMSGNSHILHFKAFTLTNLKGGAISLCIGGILYLVAVRGLLKKDGRYKDYWPKWLDLEDLVYRGIPARFIFALWCTVLRIVEMSTDTIIVLIRKTFMRETRVRNNSHRFGLAGVMAAEFSEAAKPIVTNFTFALLMTCLGIIVMLFAIFYFAVLL